MAAAALLVGPGLLTPQATSQPIAVGPSAALSATAVVSPPVPTALSSVPTERPTPRPSEAPLTDQHSVSAPQGTFTINYDGGVVMIGRISGFSYTELARAIVPGSAQPAFGGDKLARPIDWTMACPDAAGGAELRILFGSIYPADHPAYSGPPANGTFASDGLFLYVLGPGQVGAGSQIRVQASGGTLDVAASTFDQTLESGDRQDSGCRVA